MDWCGTVLREREGEKSDMEIEVGEMLCPEKKLVESLFYICLSHGTFTLFALLGLPPASINSRNASMLPNSAATATGVAPF